MMISKINDGKGLTHNPTVALSGEALNYNKYVCKNPLKHLSKCAKSFGINSIEYRVYSLLMMRVNSADNYYDPVFDVTVQPNELVVTEKYITDTFGVCKAVANTCVKNLMNLHYVTKTIRMTDGINGRKRHKITVLKLVVAGDDLYKYIGVKDMAKSKSAKDRAYNDHCSAEEYEDAKDYCYQRCKNSNIILCIDYLMNEVDTLKSEVNNLNQAYYDLNNRIIDLEEA